MRGFVADLRRRACFYNQPAMPLERLSIATDAQFWPVSAKAVLEFAARTGQRQRQLQALTWLVPGGVHAVLARTALREALGQLAFIPPRVTLLTEWIGRPLTTDTAARAELFTALRANAWVRESFGTQPAALWALAIGVAQLCDELTWAAVGASAFEARLQASLARHFHRRAARALEPQAQLVLQLWRARREADDGAARGVRELQARANAAAAPLVYTAGTGPGVGLAPWEEAFLQRYSLHAPVLLIEPDTRATLLSRPLLAAAWPELSAGNAHIPIAVRADAVGPVTAPLSILVASSLEQEAAAVAGQVLQWRGSGVGAIALVALDRLTARRARALLERAQVSVRDETGWKLSTTSAAAAVMRWFDLVSDDAYWRDLLDWLKSPFTLADRPHKALEVAVFERAIRAGGVIQGARAIRRALIDFRANNKGEVGGERSRDEATGALDVLALIEAQAQIALRAGSTLVAHAQALAGALDALGMRAGLAADSVGRCVLRELDALDASLAAVAGRATLAEFRALLAARFEEVAYIDRQVESPVVMVSLAATSLRTFDAALLIGADARHLPTVPAEFLFMSNAVRSELGLSAVDIALRAQATQLAALLATVPRVVASWRTHRGDEPNPISPLLERLQFVSKRATGDDLQRRFEVDGLRVEPIAPARPAPRAAMLLPARISAGAGQSLVNCAYQFYARRMLQLATLDDVIEMPDKRDFGEALHEVLRRFHVEWGAADFHALEAAVLVSSLTAHAQAVFEPQIERTPGLLAFKRRFERLISGYIDWLQQHSSEGWRWRSGEETHTQRITLRHGRAVELVGRVDRIDEHGDGRMRVLDYKARAVDILKRGLKVLGEDIQLPFYGLLLAQRAESAAYVSFDRAKEDKRGVEAVSSPHPFDALVQSVAVRLQADMQRIGDGAPLPAIGAATVCEHCEMRGLCRRDYWDRSADAESAMSNAKGEVDR